jgi:hypothetical protein
MAEQPVDALVADHRAGHAVAGGPAAQPAQREPVGHLDMVGVQSGEEPLDPVGVEQAVAAGAGDARRGQSDPLHAAREQRRLVPRTGNDEADSVPAGDVSVAEVVQGGAQAAGSGTVEVGELDDPHASRHLRHRTERGDGLIVEQQLVADHRPGPAEHGPTPRAAEGVPQHRVVAQARDRGSKRVGCTGGVR